LQAQYETEQRLARTFGFFAALAIIIACLGLFGLVAYTAERRTKEIGIRKVLGASVSSIVRLLSTDFVRLVLIAFVVATPLAWFAMNRWLEDFAYRIEIGPGIFLLAGGAALLIALATVSYQAIKAALADPVKSLRYE
jgi:putative ABC transport system permease protein